MIGLNKKHIQKEELLHEWFYQKYSPSTISAMTLMQEAAGIPAILELVLIIARLIRNLARLKSKYREIAISNISKQMVPKIVA